jgi:hypothetical protein
LPPSPPSKRQTKNKIPTKSPETRSARATMDDEMNRLVQLDGLAVRRRRHDHGWSPRELVTAIEEASFSSSGLRRTLTPNQIAAIEERAERVSYASLLLLADGLDCDPVDLLAADEMRRRRRDSLLN